MPTPKTLPQSELLREIQIALNAIRKSKYKGGVYSDTYELAAELDRHLAIDNAPGKEALIAKAQDLYQNDDCEIDEDARLSPADDGTWVQAWVWVPHADMEAA